MTPLIIPNDNTKEKEYIKSNMKMSPKKLPKIEKTKTSEKFKEKEKINYKIKEIMIYIIILI